MAGGSGNDSLWGGDGADNFIGGAGNDTLEGENTSFDQSDIDVETMDGGLGDDVYVVDNASDVLTDAGGIDTVKAWNMHWTLGAGFENLIIHNDEAESGFTGIGNELDNQISATYAGSRLEGRDGDDTLIGANGQGVSNELLGGAGNDSLVSGGLGGDRLDGGTGVDTLTGAGSDPGEGEDFVFSAAPGAANADIIVNFGQFSRIVLDGAAMPQVGVSGRFVANDERFAANSTGAAQDGSDRVVYNTSNGQLWYDADGNGAGAAQLIATLPAAPAGLTATDIVVENGTGPAPIVGTEGDDTLTGTDGDDTINGLGGNDELHGGEGADSIVGGDGNDLLMGDGTGVFESDADTLDGGLGNDEYWVGYRDTILPDSGGVDTVFAVDTDWTLGSGLENLTLLDEWDEPGTGTGNELDNVIRAGSSHGMGGNDLLIFRSGGHGGDGNDTLRGDGVIDGGAGNDVLQVAGGADRHGDDRGHILSFSVAPGAANADEIRNFRSEVGTIRLDANVHLNAGSSGFFAAGDARFAANSSGTAQDASDRVVYNTTSGELWYDVDGSGAGTAQLIATLEGAPTLVAADIEIINGSNPDDVINGTSGDDSLAGGAGEDTINGLGGNDTLDGGTGADSMTGGDGDDMYVVDSGGDVVVELQNGGIDEVHSNLFEYTLDDWVNNLTLGDGAVIGVGNAIDNLLMANALGSELYGAAGNDTLFGGAAEDRLRGESGNDSIIGGADNDFLDGGAGNDTLLGGVGSDFFGMSGSGNDLIDGGSDSDTVQYDSAQSAVVVNLAAGTATGGGASGTGSASLANIEGVHGSGFADVIIGGSASNELFGAGGNDTLDGGGGFDVLRGGAGADTFVFGAPQSAPSTVVTDFSTGVDTVRLNGALMSELGPSGRFAADDARFYAAAGANSGHDADDRIIYNTSTGQLYYDADGNGAGAGQLLGQLNVAPAGSGFHPPAPLAASDIEIINGSAPGNVINGTSGADTLTDTAGNDTINGLAGNDTINGGHGGTDVVNGGDGRDSLQFMTAPGAVVVDFVTGVAGTTSFTNIEKVVTGDFDDQLTGDALAQNLTARSGSDTLAGAGGVDTLWGGAGADTFIFRENGTANADVIGDWTSGSDEVALDNAAMGTLGADGAFVAGDARFWSSSTGVAHDANDRVIYNTSSGQLYYDADGNGSGAAQLIATFTGSPTVAATDISVI
jgi:Ca2+-binding RTX toxin-like protein